jgi:hypothetical protein
VVRSWYAQIVGSSNSGDLATSLVFLCQSPVVPLGSKSEILQATVIDPTFASSLAHRPPVKHFVNFVQSFMHSMALFVTDPYSPSAVPFIPRHVPPICVEHYIS